MRDSCLVGMLYTEGGMRVLLYLVGDVLPY